MALWCRYFVAGGNILLAQPPSPKTEIAQPATIQGLSENSTATMSATLYKVTKVRDGDTIEVDYNGKTEAVRLVGIDTPETVDPRKPVQCFGVEASNKLKLLLSDTSVSLEVDETQSDRDKYGRLLRFVFWMAKMLVWQCSRRALLKNLYLVLCRISTAMLI